MLVDPWSVSPEAVDQLAVQFFAASLFPYLTFLYYIRQPETNCPPLANFGFQFLLAFVFATIPAGIYAKIVYTDILANIDWLHGTAESLLTITNLLIVVGFKQALQRTTVDMKENDVQGVKVESPILATSTAFALSLVAIFGVAAFHLEPANALSLPTWIVHVSSLLEWLAAMALVWDWAHVTGCPQWKGLVWAMLPLHTSGLCACTYHLFYNAPTLNWLVAVQAALTCFGNAAMAFATWRIFSASKDANVQLHTEKPVASLSTFPASPFQYYVQLAVPTVLLSIIVKWGSLTLDFPLHPTVLGAASVVAVPTGLNALKWAIRSQRKSDDFPSALL